MRTFVIVSLWRLVAGFSNQHYRLILLLIWFLILHEIIIQIAVGWCKWTRGFCRDKAIALQLKGHYYLLVSCDASWLTFRLYLIWTADSFPSATEATLVFYRFALESFLNFSSLSTLGLCRPISRPSWPDLLAWPAQRVPCLEQRCVIVVIQSLLGLINDICS